MQEVGGKKYAQCMKQVADFVQKFQQRLAQFGYTIGHAYMDEAYDLSDSFTALGNVYLVHESAATEVSHYDFATETFHPLSPGFSLDGGDLTQTTHVTKKRFPSDFWPSMKWGRKGFLHTRWLFSGIVLDLVNVHLFHDDSNLVNMDEEQSSVYSNNRKRALNCVLSEVESRHAGYTTGVGVKPALFVFGDLNFRLDSNSFIKRIAPETEKRPVELLEVPTSPSNCSDLKNGSSLRRTLSAVEFRKPGEKMAHSDSDRGIVLRVERKRFDYFNENDLMLNWKRYLSDDKELRNFPTLREMEINFQPTYPWSEDPDETVAFMKTRPPAWCDRVLMNDRAYSILQDEEANNDDLPPEYQSIGRLTCMGDHKPVYLSLSLPEPSRSRTNAHP
uniref:inositol-polyphosphate 5-phosphatase n=1 Tax=Plectus sambesii TaxID=2011161 RepID=A0A914W902_9BILA